MPFVGSVTRIGATYYVDFALVLSDAHVAVGLSALSIVFLQNETDLGFDGTPALGADGVVRASGELTSPVLDNRPVMVRVACVHAATPYSGFLPAAAVG